MSQLAAFRPTAAGTAHPSWRPDIDGLRAIAVAVVVLFHGRVTGLEGGFVGVDMFFVLSGYLIGQVLDRAGTQSGRLSADRTGMVRATPWSRALGAGALLADFYARRVRRIIPALAVMVLVALVGFTFILIPTDYKMFGQSVAATLTATSNFYFLLRSGYFDPTAESQALLTTWSLAIEAQFYLTYPLALLVIWQRTTRPWHAPLVAALALISLTASILLVRLNPDAAYYVPWSRFWELLAGAWLAHAQPAAPARAAVRRIVTLTGLVLVLAPAFLYDSTTPFPGVAAVPPVAGTLLLLWSGSGQPTRLLQLPGMAWLGKISYSVYLWHWPLLVGWRQVTFSEPPLWLYLGATLVASWLSWRLVEMPTRGSSGPLGTPRALWLFTATAAVLAVLVGVALHGSHGAPGRLNHAAQRFAAGALDTNPRRASCDSPDTARLRADDVCLIGAGAGEADDRADGETIRTPEPMPTFALLGDSFGDAIMPGVSEAGRQTGRSGVALTRGGCTPLVGVGEPHSACTRLLEESLAYLDRHDEIRRVLVVARWTTPLTGVRFGAFHARPLVLEDQSKQVGLSPVTGHATPSPTQAALFETGLKRLIKRLQRVPGREVVVLAHIPEQRYDIPRALAGSERFGLPAEPALPRALHDTRQAGLVAVLERLQSQVPFEVVDVSSLLCDRHFCAVERDGAALYADDSHLSATGAIALAPLWARALLPPP